MTRRQLLAASAALPILASAIPDPLDLGDLRLLAMGATPRESWPSAEAYLAAEPRRIMDESPARARVEALVARGLLQKHEPSTTWSMHMDWYATTTDAGRAELRRHGVDDV